MFSCHGRSYAYIVMLDSIDVVFCAIEVTNSKSHIKYKVLEM